MITERMADWDDDEFEPEVPGAKGAAVRFVYFLFKYLPFNQFSGSGL